MQLQAAQTKRTTAKRSGRRRKRAADLMPELIRQIPLFYEATGFDSERVAGDIGVCRLDVVDVYLRSLRRGPGSACGLHLVGRAA